jgi:hypothetical protein
MRVESTVRAMTKTERRDYLRSHGWTRLSARGSETWFHPTHDQPEGDRGFYTLAAAIRTAVVEEVDDL